MSPKGRYGAALDGLPQDWRTVQIAQLGKVISGGTPSREVPAYWGGDIPWLTPGELTSLKSKNIKQTGESITEQGLNGSGANLLPAGSLLITTRATLGARAINTVPMATNQGFKSIVFQNPKDADYYYYWAEKLETELIRRASGTTFLEISGSQFCQISVPYPPGREQQKIAQIFDTLDTQIRQTEALITKLERIKQGLLTDLLTRGIDQNGQLRPTPDQAPHLYKDSPLERIPKDWEARPLVDTLTLQRGFDITAAQQTAGEYPVVSSSGVSSYHNAYMIQGPGVVTGRKGKLGVTYYIDSNFWPHDTSLYVNNFHGNDRKFAVMLLNSLRLERFDAATSVPTLNRNFVHPLLIAIPPIDEQRKIVDMKEGIDSRIYQECCLRDQLIDLKSGLMDDLLTGRVRVTPLLDSKKRATA